MKYTPSQRLASRSKTSATSPSARQRSIRSTARTQPTHRS
jgi:hypothetical protein